MKTWIVSEYFFPEEVSTGYLLTQISRKLYLTDNQLSVITKSTYATDNEKQNIEKICSETIRIKNFKIKSNSLFYRFLKQLLLSISFFYKCFFYIKKNSRVIIVTNPAFLVLFISLLKKIKNIQYILIVHDVFPDNLVPIKVIKKNSIIFQSLNFLFQKAYSSVDKLIVIGEDMKQLLIDKKINCDKISIIQNWADSLEIYPIMNFNVESYYNNEFENKIVIQFAGNIGKLQGLENFIKLFKIANNKELILIIIGSGTEASKLKFKNKNENILFYDSKPRSEQNEFLNACDISLISLIEGMYGIGVPSKTYNILAAGKPILYIGDKGTEVYNYIENEGIGWNFLWNQNDSIVKFLENIRFSDREKFSKIGKKSRKYVENNFTKEIILNSYQKIVFD